MTKIAILGGSGYTAVELIKILLRHPFAQIEAITTRQEGNPLVSEIHPSLLGRIDRRFEAFDPDALQRRGVQCAFGCLPHGVSAESIKPLLARGIRVVDLSADYRLRDPFAYATWYGQAHHDTDNLAQAVYGLPEVYGDRINNAKLVANPGCYPQTAILGLAPLLANKLISPTGIIVNSCSGVSGAGRTPKLTTLFPECNESVSAYSIGKHRHQPEMEQVLADVAGEPVEILFAPHLVPMDRGIFSTIYATPLKHVAEGDLVALYRTHYAAAPFVRVRENLPASKETSHTNFLDVCVKVVRDKIVVLACEDNLIRGASGVAVQNFNRMFGYDERTGLMG